MLVKLTPNGAETKFWTGIVIYFNLSGGAGLKE
jgi:hypothetical protein